MDEGFRVERYSIERLTALLTDVDFPQSVIAGKLHITFFEEYFAKLGAATIVVEEHYIDHNYTQDFAAYYVRCFGHYKKRCIRLHFFTCEFSPAAFRSVVLGGERSDLSCATLQKDYLGFIVVKPLPDTVVGRTCLKTYPEDGFRHYPVLRTAKANLFGLPLEVESLPFQEQDFAVAACSTTAVWSALQGTGHLFHHPIPSPVRITQAANAYSARSRTLPSKGLTVDGMAFAIRDVGLDPFPLQIPDADFLRRNVYGYVSAGIPIVLAVSLYDLATRKENDLPTLLGGHAVTITGYRLEDGCRRSGYLGQAFVDNRITKLYVHDDQVGPFARMPIEPDQNCPTLLNLRRCLMTAKMPNWHTAPVLGTSWTGRDGTPGSVIAVAEHLLIPLYHKIRIPLDVVHDTVAQFSYVLNEARSVADEPKLRGDLEWDILLTTVNDLKADLLAKPSPDEEELGRVLFRSMPKYIWRAIGYCAGVPFVELLFDATDIERGNHFLGPIEHNPFFALPICYLARDEDHIQRVDRSLRERQREGPDDATGLNHLRNVLQWYRTRPIPGTQGDKAGSTHARQIRGVPTHGAP